MSERFILYNFLLVMFILSYSNEVCAQIHKTVWFDSYRNKKFEQLGVEKQKIWIENGKDKRLASVKHFNKRGFLTLEDSLIYNSNGDLISKKKRSIKYADKQITEYFSDSLMEGNTETMTRDTWYDDKLRKIEEVNWKSVTGDTTKIQFSYDTYSNCISMKSLASGIFSKKKISYRYNKDGIILEEKIISSNNSIALIQTYIVNEFNKIEKIIEGDRCIESRKYNNRELLVEVNNGCSKTVPENIFWLNSITTYKYDCKRRVQLVSRQYENGSGYYKERYDYFANNLVKRIRNLKGKTITVFEYSFKKN